MNCIMSNCVIDSRGASTKTRIETLIQASNLGFSSDSRGASTKTRIETNTIINKNSI